MRTFPRTGCRRLSAAVAAVAVGVGLLSVTTGPSANAGELRDRQKSVQKEISRADHELEESSSALRRATEALSRSREQLTEARAELGDVRARLEIAQQRDEEMKAALSAAEARLEQASADVATGKAALQDQRDVVIDTVTSLYQQGDPDLMAFTAILSSQTPSDITRQREANRSLVELQGNEYDDLHAAEVLLRVHEDEVEEATAEVAEKRQEAADHLVAMQGLTQEALDAKERVRSLVGSRKDAEARAERAKAKDRKALRQLKKQEARIQQLIQQAIREARERARRKAARAAAEAAKAAKAAKAAQAARAAQAGNAANLAAPMDTDGLLMHPVNGPVTSPFGYRTHPIYGYWGLHDGDDFGASCGAPLVAVRGGTVLTEYYSTVWGNRLYLNVGMVNGNFITVVYNHLSRYNVGVGATVERGDVVGYVGTTGWSTGCHLHFTVMENGKPVDPMKYF